MAASANALRDSARQILHEQHGMMRDVVTGLSPDALNWRPGAETNSIAQMLAHALESERYLISCALNRTVQRDRQGPFETKGASADDLLRLIDQADSAVDGLLDELTDADLAKNVTRTIAVGQRTRPGAGWLIQAVAHAREHIGQASLTRQLYEQQH